MTIEIKVPAMGESVTEATVARWFKKEGESVARDEPMLELETDKVTVEVPAPAAGSIESISVQAGATVQVGAILGSIAEGKAGKAAARRRAAAAAPRRKRPSLRPRRRPTASKRRACNAVRPPHRRRIRRLHRRPLPAPAAMAASPRATCWVRWKRAPPSRPRPPPRPAGPRSHAEREEKVAMTRLRKTIALRLKESQNTAAQLTTFNEVDMTRVMALRSEYKDSFEKKHGVRLGFMGFFAKACVAALKEIPNVNAEIEGDNIIYKNYYDIGIAVSTERGLVVPVVRDADQLSLAGIEKAVMDFGLRARDNKLKLEELQGGTFSITNGGVFGSLMSTPILNSPQSGILGMHKIQPRPMAIDGKVEIRPDDVSGADLRSPPGRWPRSRHLPGAGEGKSGRPGAFVVGRLIPRWLAASHANDLTKTLRAATGRPFCLSSAKLDVRHRTTSERNIMAYVEGFVIAVPKDRLEDYKEMARIMAPVWKDHGALDYVECVGEDTPYGELTSFPRAVLAKEDEVVMFSWIVYDVKGSARRRQQEARSRIRALKRFMKDMPFDGKRMIFGGFVPFLGL